MGLFGRRKKREEEERREEEARQRDSRRRSRRIVTPGAAPGGPPAGARTQGSSRVTRTPSRPAPAAQPGQAQPGQVPRPAQQAPQQLPPQVRPSQQAVVRPAPPPPPAPPKVPVAGPTVQRGDGQKPITETNEINFTGSLQGAGGEQSSSGEAALVSFLVDKVSILDANQVRQAQEKAKAESIPFDVACYRLEFMTEEQLVNALTQECWVPHLKVDKYEIRQKALDAIDQADARAFSVLPVDKLGNILNLAMVNPLDVEAISQLELKTGLDIKKVVAARSEIDRGIEHYYGSGQAVAKAGGLDIEQDHESHRVTRMLQNVSVVDTGATAKPSPAPAPAKASAPLNVVPEIDDIDDLLSGDDEIAPTVIEAISIDLDEIEPEFDDGDVAVVDPAEIVPLDSALEPAVGGPGGSSINPAAREETSDFLPTDVSKSAAPATPAAAPVAPPSAAPIPPPPAAPAPGAAAKAPTSAFTGERSKARASNLVDLVPVMEEEFQHAITHGKSRVFEKWTSLQTRNRILNAVPVENEMTEVLAVVFQDGQRVQLG